MFSIEFERSDLMLIRVWGFWSEEQLIAFRDAVRMALPKRRVVNSFDMLVDLLDYPPQSTIVVEGGQKVIEEISVAGLRRGAIVSSSTLMRMQVERVNSWEQRRYFTSMAEARSWLAEQVAA